jgi:DHA3 family macrolide efflux protein-like MFS transporter|tara:strand:+ start:1113 stop:2381 length:1269 start_codon:yes stop_codon:yes gene_type:complete
MKNKQAIYLLFLSNIISGLAQGISMIAIPWYFIEIIDNSEYFSFSYIIITIATLFWGIYAGAIIDRYSRKKIFILTNIVCGCFIGSIALYGIYSSYLSELLVVSVFAITIFNYNIHYPNLYAFGQEITEQKNYGKLNSYIEVQGQTTSVLAGAFAAILLTGTTNKNLEIAGFNFILPFNVEKWQIYDIFLLDAFTYLAVIAIFSFIKYSPIKIEKTHTGSLFSRLKLGFNYLKDHHLIFVFGLVSYMLFAFTLVELHVILPSYVHDFLLASGNVYASAEIYYSIGAIFSGLLILRFLSRYNTILSVVVLMFVVACAFFAMTFSNSLIVFFIGSLILGITNAGVRILRTTYLFNNIPNNLIGRATSVFSSLNIIVRICLISLLTIPFFNIGDNIRWGYLIGVVLMLVSILILLILFFHEKRKT